MQTLPLLTLCALLVLPTHPAFAAQSGFPESEVRAALRDLERALQADDRTAWVYHYTEDAVFVGEGAASIQGRDALLSMAREMSPMRSVKIAVLRIEGTDRFAYTYVRGSWVSGEAATLSRVRSLLVWRKDPDNTWRVTQELMHTDPETP